MTWDITDPNARLAILNDENRSDQAKQEDLVFFNDFVGPNATRKWAMAGRDEDYDRELLTSLLSQEAKENRSKEREKKKEARKEKESRMKMVSMSIDDDQDQEDVAGAEEDDWRKPSGSGIRRSKKRRRCGGGGGGGGGDSGTDSDDDDYGVWLRIPRDILKLTSSTAVRKGMFHGDHVAMLASVILNSGGDLDDFILSYSSSIRMRKEAIEEIYEETRETFREHVVREDCFLSLHFDEAEMTDTIGPEGSRVEHKHKRLAVTLTSPFMEAPLLVCAGICADGTGAESATQAVEGVEELGVMPHVWNLVYDTTLTNSSPTVGAAALIEQHRGSQLLKSPCRRHITGQAT